jgi:hypothetical protein
VSDLQGKTLNSNSNPPKTKTKTKVPLKDISGQINVKKIGTIFLSYQHIFS